MRTTFHTRTDPIVPTTAQTRRPSSSPILSINDPQRRFQNKPSLVYGRHPCHTQDNTIQQCSTQLLHGVAGPLGSFTSSNGLKHDLYLLLAPHKLAQHAAEVEAEMLEKTSADQGKAIYGPRPTLTAIAPMIELEVDAKEMCLRCMAPRIPA
jgi:hypothetical protein